ncbi:MAG: hypothetical protein K1X79_09190 [Oligoflexia bacterium]|nr:hypothetical protein [Oligoflexia bacterium]
MPGESSRGLISVAPFDLRQDWKFLGVCLLLGLAVRIDFWGANQFVVDSDEAIVGLMAQHIAAFKDLPAFFYGQHYMGSLEALFAAVLFLIVGASSLALKAVPLSCSLLLVLLVYQLGVEFGSRGAARLAALFVALPPQMLVVWSGMARGGYMEILCIGSLALICGVRWLRLDSPWLRHTSIVAALLGLGWWVNNQIVYFALPLVFFMGCAFLQRPFKTWAERGRQISQHAGAALAAFVVGGFPFWFHNLLNNFVSFEVVQRARSADMLEHVEGLVKSALPMIIGARRQWHTEDVFLGATPIVSGLTAYLLLLVLHRRRYQLRQLFMLRIDKGAPIELLILMIPIVLGIFCMSSFGFLVESPRYLLPLYIPLSILSAFGVLSAYSLNRALGVASCVGLLVINLASTYLGGRALPGEPVIFKGERVSKNHSELNKFLLDRKIELVRANYWIGYRLAFETEEKVRFSIFKQPETVRIPAYEQDAQRIGREYLPLVLVPGEARIVKRALDVQGIRYEEHNLSGYKVLINLQPVSLGLQPVRATQAVASASDNPLDAGKALDGIPGTRWGSARPQVPGMTFVVNFEVPMKLRGVRYELGEWTHDEPTELLMDIELNDGTRRTILGEGDYAQVRYLREHGSSMLFAFEPALVRRVRLTQMGSQQFFDWSIAELEMLQ